MAEPFLAEIKIVGFNFAPRGWAYCDGQILPINQNQALYSLLGTTYGGDGRSTFGLPDLRGRSPIHKDDVYRLGNKGGEETHVLQPNESPSHTHLMRGSSGAATDLSPAGNVLANVETVTGVEQYAGTGDTAMNAANIQATGGQGHNNMQPYLVLGFAIAVSGVFPSRN